MMTANCGASLFPFMMFIVAQSREVQYSFVIIVAAVAAGTAFTLFISLFNPLRDMVDLAALPVDVQRLSTNSLAVASGGLNAVL